MTEQEIKDNYWLPTIKEMEDYCNRTGISSEHRPIWVRGAMWMQRRVIQAINAEREQNLAVLAQMAREEADRMSAALAAERVKEISARLDEIERR